MTKIYIQNKPLFLAAEINEETEDYLHRPETIFIDELNAPAVKTMLHQMEQPQFYQGIFLHSKIDELLAAFKAQLNVIAAAGGLVHTKENDLLLIHRLGRWDLPKGKLDEGESLEECALREIWEETGADGLRIEQRLQVTYHTYHQGGKHNLKESHWFLIGAAEKLPLKPQTEENIEKCVWVPAGEIQSYIDGAFPSIANVLKEGTEVLRKMVK